MVYDESTVTFRGINSKMFGMSLLPEVELSGARPEIDVIDVAGKNGSLLLSKGKWFDIPFHVKMFMEKLPNKTIEHQIDDAKNWLSNGGYGDFSSRLYPDRIFRARVSVSSFTRKSNTRCDCSIDFELFPLKYIQATYSSARALTSGASFNSQGTQPAKPIITLTGTGNIVLTVNGKNFVLKNITNGVVIDCENQVVTDLAKRNSQMDKVYSYPFPVLKLGNNTISWDNTAFTATIIERWCELA